MQWTIQFLLGLAIAIPEWALLEYCYHRWVMHRKSGGWFRSRFLAHVAHHRRRLGEFSGQADHADDEVSVYYNLVWTSWAWIPFGIFISWPLAVAFVAVGTFHGLVWVRLHRQMHAPTNPWWTRNRVFRNMVYHHRVHHRYPGYNHGILFAPWTDILFRTRRPADGET